jgi:hypothetical protein
LDQVQVLADPVSIEPDPKELAKREKLRQGWRQDRARKKAEKQAAA